MTRVIAEEKFLGNQWISRLDRVQTWRSREKKTRGIGKLQDDDEENKARDRRVVRAKEGIGGMSFSFSASSHMGALIMKDKNA